MVVLPECVDAPAFFRYVVRLGFLCFCAHIRDIDLHRWVAPS
jgi:hypothetical protein